MNQASPPTGDSDASSVRAAQTVESVVGNAWAADPAGRFSYVTPAVLASLGLSLEELNPLSDDAYGWKRVIHPEDYPAAAAAWRHCLETGEHYNVEHRMLRADGGYGWGRCSGQPLRDADGRITGWYGTVIDREALPVVAQRSIDLDVYEKSQAALREGERELAHLVDMVPSHVWRLKPDGEPAFFNQRMVNFIGLDVADTDRPGMTRLSTMVELVVHPEDAAKFGDVLRSCLATGEHFAMRYRLRGADGAYRWMSSRAEPMRDHAGRIVQWYGICHDIDDQVHAEEALRRSERHLQQLIDALPVNVLSWTPAGELTYVSKRYLEEVGLSVANFTEFASASQELVHPEDAVEVRRTAARCIQTGEPFVMRYRRRGKDGTYRYMDGRFEPLRDRDGTIREWYGISIDIDDLMRAQEALRERERELSLLVDLVPSFLWRLTPEGEPNFYSKRLLDFFGPEAANAQKPGKSRLASIIESAVHPEDAVRLAEALNRSFTTGESVLMKFRLRRADGVYRWVEARAEPLRDQNGRILQWYGLSHDIDDQLRVEEVLRERERALWQLVETLPAMIDCAAANGEPLYRSQQLREFLGYNLEELDETGKSRLEGTLDAGVHPDDLAGVKERYAHSLSTGEPYARRHRLRRFDGEFRWVETRAAPMRNSEGAIVQWNVICLDIDAEVRAQQELRLAQEGLARASQAASLAELSASIAHEVNQPLAAVVANSHACERWLSANPPNLERAQKTVERIIRDANSAADVVSRIRALFRRAMEARSVTALDGLVAEARDLLAEEAARRRVRIDIEIEASLPPVALDRIQIQQVLINLIRNGMEAIDPSAGSGMLGIRLCRTGDVIRTEVSDSGPGVEFPDKIFEPFFTTKQNGMGMGLAICRSIVESHGGRLWVEQNEPRGATFVFTLPIQAKAAA